ncbi:B-cell receptor CD22 [Sorex araneus]|uniref:B-cell receptor CD22 n=1 Tax=Sorex araneus TaxID=42254 RepID=UPI002433933E|nr:B-cell receptor CD22 [Sorex araneus]
MHLLGPLLLLLEYVAFSDSTNWQVHHPPVLYAWEGGCVWIPCTYMIPGNGILLENLIVYHNYTYDKNTKDFSGTILSNITGISKKSQTQELPAGDPRVQFLGNNRSNCTLRIRPVHVHDNGLLGLRMMAKADKWMENVTLNISETAPPPSIELPPEILESRMAILNCSVNTACFGYHIGLQWSLEGSVINSTNLTPTSVVTKSQLTFQAEWTHHGRTVTCQLWDHEKGRLLSEASAELNVKYTPKLHIEVTPQDAVVTEGDQVTMTCQIISSNPTYHTFSWLKDGKQLDKQDELKEERHILTLSVVTRNMIGQYQCQASNALGIGQSEKVNLQVHYPPEPPKVQIFPSIVKEGNSVRLTCLSSASPPPTNFTWFRDGQALLGGNQNLQITKAFLNHSGSYSCQAENTLGHGLIGQEAQLDVQYPAKGVMAVIQTSSWIREGDDVTLRCKFNSSNPAVTHYKWKPQGTQGGSEVLTISNIAWDAKPVTCAACNQWCSWARDVDLHVQYAPRDVTVRLSSSSVVRSGQQLLLSCNYSSSRPAAVHIRWRKDGTQLREGRELRFPAILPEDAGTYHCEVNNTIGQTQSQAQVVSVLYPPRKLRVSFSPQDGVVEGTRAMLSCEGDANPPIRSYSWFDGNNQELHHYGQTLRLDPVKIQHSGTYWCRGANGLGMGQSPPTLLTVYYSSETIARRTALGLSVSLTILFLVVCGVKFQLSRKRIRSQQDLQENSSGRSFFVRNKKVRSPPLVESTPFQGCYNPVMEDATSYAILSFPDTPRNEGTSEAQRPSPHWGDSVTYSVVQKQKRPVGDYENVNVAPGTPEDEGIHYSELVQFGHGARSPAPDPVEYVTLKH